LVYFSPFWYFVPRKIWQPWTQLLLHTKLSAMKNDNDGILLDTKLSRMIMKGIDADIHLDKASNYFGKVGSEQKKNKKNHQEKNFAFNDRCMHLCTNI
jgi:hypothetical protein